MAAYLVFTSEVVSTFSAATSLKCMIRRNPLYTIEEFSIITKILYKDLRKYNDLDLLKPVVIDSNGHYYYDDKSLLKAQLILVCIECNMSLNGVRNILRQITADRGLKSILTSLLNYVEDERKIIKIQKLLDNLKYDQVERIRMTGNKENIILSIREPGNRDSLNYTISKLLNSAADLNLEISGPYTVIWHGLPEYDSELFDVEAYIPVKKSEDVESSLLKVRESMKYCVIDFIGSTLTLSTAYSKLYTCIKGNGLRIAGPFEETFITDQLIQLGVPVTI